MPRVRLTGLLLFITAILLGLASAATRTSHLRVEQPSSVANPVVGPTTELPPESQPLDFVNVPIFYPLAVVAAAGLLMWFVPAAIIPEPSYRRSGTRRRKSKPTGFRFFRSR